MPTKKKATYKVKPGKQEIEFSGKISGKQVAKLAYGLMSQTQLKAVYKDYFKGPNPAPHPYIYIEGEEKPQIKSVIPPVAPQIETNEDKEEV